jgi:hypothetical protein
MVNHKAEIVQRLRDFWDEVVLDWWYDKMSESLVVALLALAVSLPFVATYRFLTGGRIAFRLGVCVLFAVVAGWVTGLLASDFVTIGIAGLGAALVLAGVVSVGLWVLGPVKTAPETSAQPHEPQRRR